MYIQSAETKYGIIFKTSFFSLINSIFQKKQKKKKKQGKSKFS